MQKRRLQKSQKDTALRDRTIVNLRKKGCSFGEISALLRGVSRQCALNVFLRWKGKSEKKQKPSK